MMNFVLIDQATSTRIAEVPWGNIPNRGDTLMYSGKEYLVSKIRHNVDTDQIDLIVI